MHQIVSKRQLWTLDGTTLRNKANDWRSNDDWKLRIKVENGGGLENSNNNKKIYLKKGGGHRELFWI